MGMTNPFARKKFSDAVEEAHALMPDSARQDRADRCAKAMKQDMGQIKFYLYDRGQCFNKGEEAVLAMVNMNGCAAHYMINSSDRTWAFVQLPHLNTEQRACDRMGYRNIDAMHEHLFELFERHLVSIGWAKH